MPASALFISTTAVKYYVCRHQLPLASVTGTTAYCRPNALSELDMAKHLMEFGAVGYGVLESNEGAG
jgi:hypothetical protein